METIVNNPKLRALLSVRNLSKALESHYHQMKQIEESLDVINHNALDTLETYSTKEGLEKWNLNVQQVKDSVYSIDEVLFLLQDNLTKKGSAASEELWEKFELYENKLLEAVKTSEKTGFEVLPESEHKHWQKDICNFEDAIMELMVSHLEACKRELKMIAKYAPKKINVVTQIIIDHLPEEFTFEEAGKYEQDYLKAFEEYKKEFSQEKNLWDKFLDLLAGGTHQSPSERIMMQRWLDGDKKDL